MTKDHVPRTIAERVRQRRDKLRAAGLRPVQLWLPDTRSPGFAAAVRRQCKLIAGAAVTAEGREEAAFREAVTADTWEGRE
jgi:hypothetical protein